MGRDDKEWTDSWDSIAGFFFFFQNLQNKFFRLFFFLREEHTLRREAVGKEVKRMLGRQKSQQVLVEPRVSQHFGEAWK